jgi:hypothetical protein
MENTKELLYESPAAEFIMFDANDCFLRTSGTGNTGVGGDIDDGNGGSND